MTRSTRHLTSALAVAFVAGTLHLAVAANDAAVSWTRLVNVSVEAPPADASSEAGAILRKTGGCDGCYDAAAMSEQELHAGDGYIEFTVGEAKTLWVAGLNHGDEGAGYADMDFAFRFNGAGSADVLENGNYLPGSDTPYAAGDVFRIAIVDGRVQYSKNSVPLKESANAPTYPLSLDVALASAGASLRQARIGGSAASRNTPD